MKKPLRLLSLFCLALCLLSCSSKSRLVGLFIYDEQDPFIEAFARQIVTDSKGLFSVQEYDAGGSQLIQNQQIDSLLKRKPALVMVNPVDRLGAFAIVRRLKAADVPVIFFNRQPLQDDIELWNRTYYVGDRAEQSGRFEANLVMHLFGDNPKKLNEYDRNGDGVIQAIILKGEQGHQDAEARTNEVLRCFAERGFKLEILAVRIADWSYDEAYTKMGRLLAQYKDRIELVISNNDAMALGAIRRMREGGFFADIDANGHVDRHGRSWVPVVGIDGLPEAIQSVKNGFLYGTVKNDSDTMARSMVNLARAVIADPADPQPLPVLQDGHYLWVDYQPFVAQE